MHIAASNGYLKIIKFLVDKGMSTDSKDKFGRLPIDDAVLNSQFAVVSYLKENSH